MGAMSDFSNWLTTVTEPGSKLRGAGYNGILSGVEKATNKSIMPQSYRTTMGRNSTAADELNAIIGANSPQKLNFNNDWVQKDFGSGETSVSNTGLAVPYQVGSTLLTSADYENLARGRPITALKNTGIEVGGALAKKYLAQLMVEAMKSNAASSSGGMAGAMVSEAGEASNAIGGATSGAAGGLGAASGIPGAAVGIGMDAATGELQENPGRSVGSGVGTAVGAGVGTIFGPVGTMAGGMIGNKVGGVIGNVIQKGDVIGGLEELNKPPDMNPMAIYEMFKGLW